jgi:uncharacterized protein YneR
MWLQAILTAEDIKQRLTETTPLRIGLDKAAPDRSLWLSPPSEVTLVPDVGIRVVVRARVHWDLLGIGFPFTIQKLTVMLTPTVRQEEGKDALRFTARVEEADCPVLPGMVETPLIARLNEVLAKDDAALVWNFMETLDFNFDLPESLQPTRKLRLFARWGAVRVSEEGLSLAVAFGVDTEREQGRLVVPREVAAIEAALDTTQPAAVISES